MNCVLATTRSWNEPLVQRLARKTKAKFFLINSKADLTLPNLYKIKPRYIFFPHWSYIIPPEIFNNYECIIFHMTDLPFGRGGSPLQNLIARGIYETQMTALKCEAGLDTGPVYLKHPLGLYGSAREIFLRSIDVVEAMIIEILNHHPVPKPQVGTTTVFRRRKPEEGSISNLKKINQIHDYIRMLDCEGYPSAFLDIGKLHLEFSHASRHSDHIAAHVKISLKK